MKWETEGGVPTKGLTYSALIDQLRQAQEYATMLAHLYADESDTMRQGFLAIGEMLGNTTILVTQLASKGRLN